MEYLLKGFVVYYLTLFVIHSHLLTPLRERLIVRTPSLIVSGKHLLECRFCLGFWVALLVCSTWGIAPEIVKEMLVVAGIGYFIAKQERI